MTNRSVLGIDQLLAAISNVVFDARNQYINYLNYLLSQFIKDKT
jgi:hypothetical protein